jgi:uncharacterized protein (TIGR00255 family)
MTGYAQGRKEQDGWAVRVSVKSVNHRFLDLKLRMPEGFDFYELRLRQMVREQNHRGHLDVHVYIEPGTAAPVQVNKELRRPISARRKYCVRRPARRPALTSFLCSGSRA